MNKNIAKDILFRSFIVILANTILSFATIWFLEPAKLYSGGATGLAQLIQRIIKACGGNISLGLLIFLVNVPIIVIGFKFVSKKFAIYSSMAIVVQSGVTALLEFIWPTSPFAHLANPVETVSTTIINGTEVTPVITESMNYGGILTLAIFGGLLAGFAAGLALKFGTSTGGIDVVSQALSLKKNISIGTATMIFNIAIAIIGGGIVQKDWYVVLFTIVRMILNSLVMDKVHTGYSYTAYYIFSSDNDGIAHDIQHELNRGVTYMEVTGGYKMNKTTCLYVVVFTHETEKLNRIITRHDKEAFVTMSGVKRIRGKFLKKSII